MKLIVITGIDGAGKTTLAKNVAHSLVDEGIPAKYLYARIYPILSRLLMFLGRAAFLRRHDLNKDYVSYDASKKSRMANPVLAFGYTSAILIDYYLQLWIKFLPRFFSRKTWIVDRYIYDTLISDLVVHLGYNQEKFESMLEKLFRFAPRPDLTILLDIPEEIAFSRKDDVVHIEYLITRRKWYLKLAEYPRVCLLDATLPPEELRSAAVKETKKLLESNYE